MKNKNPLWYNLISTFKNENMINNGLTIPFLIGAYQFKSIGEKTFSIQSVLSEIVNSRTELKPVLQHCPDIHQFVISLKSEEIYNTDFKEDFAFKNPFGERTLVITQNASALGSSVEDISNSLFPKYASCLQAKEFSWSGYEQTWKRFNDKETKLIKTVFNLTI